MALPVEHRYAVFVSGRGSNLEAILKAHKASLLPLKPALVLTDNNNAPALNFAREDRIETCFIDPKIHKGREKYGLRIIEELKKRDIDTICLAGFMRVLHENVVSGFRGRIVNIHPSLLPAFPGLHAQRQALEAGVKEAGCTVHFVTEGVDSGPIIMQAKVPVKNDDTEQTLSSRILEQEHRIYPVVIKSLLEDKIEIGDDENPLSS
ncbi:MAG: phosphoribosylglycinamide formyltransferase [Nitrospinota bacterium]